VSNDNLKEKRNNPNIFSISKYDLLIISPEKFKKYLYPLIKHKIKYGLKTKIVIPEEIYNSKYFPEYGRDRPEKIKYFIKKSIENWKISYVMLVGDINNIPIRKTYMWDGIYITDLYYSDIYNDDGSFSGWDTNNNNLFGEFHHDGNTDDLNLKPDVGIGRLACKNKIEVCNVVKKIIYYEQKTYGQKWFYRILLCGGNITGQNTKYEKYWRWVGHGSIEGEHHTKLVMNELKGFEKIKLWESTNKLSLRAIIRSINMGVGFAYFSGHGYALGWFTKPKKGKTVRFGFPYNHLLFNASKLPIIFFDGCYTGQLDYKIKNIPFPCIAWKLISKRFGGAIAVMGSSRPEFTGSLQGGGSMLGLCFFKAYNQRNGSERLSDIYMKAQKDYLRTFKDRMTLQGYNLLGDPSLVIGGYPPCKESDRD